MAIQRMENVGIVVEDLDATIAFFVELGMELEGRSTVDGQWAARIWGLDEVVIDVAMMRTPDDDGRLELMRFHRPKAVGTDPQAPANTLGIRRILFSVDDVDDVLGRLRTHGAELVGGLETIEGPGGKGYRFCYVHGPEGISVAVCEEIG